MSLLRVFRYLWEGEPLCDPGLEVWVLGKNFGPMAEWSADLRAEAHAKLWFMYRTHFPLIPRHPEGPSPLQLGTVLRGGSIDPNGFVTDVGWGCMIRTGQSLVANALLRVRAENEVAALFFDSPTAALSIHNIVREGMPRGKLPGQWFGPSTVAQCIRALSAGLGFGVHVSDGSDVYEEPLRALEYPLLVLCPVRLGIQQINEVYYRGLLACLEAPQCAGIAGGRTSASHYFYGYQGTRLFFHDPHVPKPAFVALDESIHSTELRAMDLAEMDPSMLLGFFLRNEGDLEDWRTRMTAVEAKSRVVNFSERQPAAFDDEVDGFVLCDPEDLDESWVRDDSQGSPQVAQDGPQSSVEEGPQGEPTSEIDPPEEPTEEPIGEPTGDPPAVPLPPRAAPEPEVLVATPMVEDEAAVFVE